MVTVPAKDAPAVATRSTVARKLYRTAWWLALAYGVGGLVWVFLEAGAGRPPDESLFQYWLPMLKGQDAFLWLGVGVAWFSPLIGLVLLNRWWRWLRRP